jgi:hypothetical protein
MHDTVLMIMSIRNIQSIITSYNNLNCEKIWFKGFTEYELVTHINHFIQNSNFQYYFLTSDDCYIHYDKFELLKHHLQFNDIISGWCCQRQNSTFTTILNPNNFDKLIFKKHLKPSWPNYFQFAYKTHQIAALPDLIPSAFTGWVFTGMQKKLWTQYPFNVLSDTNSNSDMVFSRNINQDNKYTPLIAKKANCIHLSNTNYPSNYDISKCFNNKQIIKSFN